MITISTGYEPPNAKKTRRIYRRINMTTHPCGDLFYGVLISGCEEWTDDRESEVDIKLSKFSLQIHRAEEDRHGNQHTAIVIDDSFTFSSYGKFQAVDLSEITVDTSQYDLRLQEAIKELKLNGVGKPSWFVGGSFI